jgi:hypothetical protein
MLGNAHDTTFTATVLLLVLDPDVDRERAKVA